MLHNDPNSPSLYKKEHPNGCYLYAAFDEIYKENPDLIKNGIQKKEDGSYDVKIGNIMSNVTEADLVDYFGDFITCNPAANGFSEAEIFEVAYIESKENKSISNIGPGKLTSYGGGNPYSVMKDMLDVSGRDIKSFNYSGIPMSRLYDDDIESLTKDFKAFLETSDYKNAYMVAYTPGEKYGKVPTSSGLYTYKSMDKGGVIVTLHCYPVDFDLENGTATVFDCNYADMTKDVNGFKFENGYTTMPLEQFFNYFENVEIVSKDAGKNKK